MGDSGLLSKIRDRLLGQPPLPAENPRVLFLTRKYPPMIGGLETLSYNLTTGYSGPKTIVALGRLQRHLVWFLPYVSLRVLLTGQKYDVIHVGDPMLTFAGRLGRAVWGKKVVVCVHGLDLVYESKLYQAYLKAFLYADTYVAISAATRELAEAKGLYPVTIITIGVSRDFFAIQRRADADAEVAAARKGRLVLMTTGRLIPRKGVAWFVTNVLPRLDVLYVVVGGGRDYERIKQAAADAGVTDKLLLIWQPEQERLYDIFRAADVFVMPNIPIPNDVEGFGIVGIEAAASGLPVVASRLEGIPDAVADGESGILVEPGNADAYVAAIEKLEADPAARVAFGEKARRYVRARNDWREVIGAYTRLFRDLCGVPLPTVVTPREETTLSSRPN
ncbi:MAG TPA: glycosyltransferase family 4 protein [Polyangiaceae bacterium]|nr:glycosyltransferase family 4 protein [Polyangiaceae bacterium]